MCVHIHSTFIHTHTTTHLYTRTHGTSTHTYTHIHNTHSYTHTHTTYSYVTRLCIFRSTACNVCICVRVCVYVCICVCRCVCTCVCAYVCVSDLNARTRTQAHTCFPPQLYTFTHAVTPFKVKTPIPPFFTCHLTLSHVWWKCIGCLKLRVSFRKIATNHRALLGSRLQYLHSLRVT